MTQVVANDSQSFDAYLANQALPFDKMKQMAFIGHLFDANNGVYKHYAPIMDKTWFSDPDLGVIFELFKHYFEAHKQVPDHLEIIHSNRLTTFDRAQVIRDKVSQSVELRSRFGIDAIIVEIEDWKNAVIFKKGINDSARAYNQSDFNKVSEIFKDCVKVANETTFVKSDVQLASDFESIERFISGREAVRFGLKLLDGHLEPDNARGGLNLGDQTLLIGSSNGGKTTTLLTTMIHNVLDDTDCLLMTHEGADADIRQKYMRCYLNLMTLPEIQRILEIDEEKAKNAVLACRKWGESKRAFAMAMADENVRIYLKKIFSHLDSRLTYLPYHRAGLEVESVMAIIDRQIQHKLDKSGRRYKLFGSDYPALITTAKASKGHWQLREILNYVYQCYVQKALEQNWHSIANSQSNRRGSQINSGIANENRLLGMEDNGESWGPVTTATNVITVNRSPDAQQRNRTYYRLAKSRSSSVGLVVAALGNFGKCVSHADGDEYGSISYHDNRENAPLMDMHLKAGVVRQATDEEVMGGNFGAEE